MISSTQLARAIAVYSKLSGVNSVNGPEGISAAVGMNPLPIINALNKGEKMGFFTLKRTKTGIDSVHVSPEQYDELALVPSNFGEEFFDFCEAVQELIEGANDRENDISRDQLMLWSGASPFVFEVAMEIVLASGSIVQYEIGDKDDKKSRYQFLTLKENADKRWGSKQFSKKSKK